MWYSTGVSPHSTGPEQRESCDNVLTELERVQIFRSLINDYDPSIRAQINEQLNVTVNFYIQSLSKIDQAAMDYEMVMFFSVEFRNHFKSKSAVFELLKDKSGKMTGLQSGKLQIKQLRKPTV